MPPMVLAATTRVRVTTPHCVYDAKGEILLLTLRAPMGLSSSGDEYNKGGDKVLEGITDFQKVVDDSIIYSKDFEDHVKTVRKFLSRCNQTGITLNRKRFKFAEESVEYVEYVHDLVGLDF